MEANVNGNSPLQKIDWADANDPLLPPTHENYDINKLLIFLDSQINRFRRGDLRDGTESYRGTAAVYEMGQELPDFADHGFRHGRHVEKSIRYGVTELEKAHPDFFNSSFGIKTLYALMLFPHFHDWDQVNGAYMNQMPWEPQRNEKKGHAIASAVMVKAMTEHIAQILHISFDDADEITSIYAVLAMRHDEPGNIDKTFNSENVDPVTIEDDEKLASLFEADQLMLHRLSSRQMIVLLRYQKEKAGFITSLRPHGLLPEFENDFAKKLQAMEQDDNPLLNLTPQQHNIVKTAVDIAYWGDMVPMVAPVWSAITRTLLSAYSQTRPFFRSQHAKSQKHKDKEVGKILRNINDPAAANTRATDVETLLWDFIHLESLSKKSIFFVLPSIQRFALEHRVMGAMALRKLGIAIMEANYEVIEGIYSARIELLNEQTAAKAQDANLDTLFYGFKIYEENLKKEQDKVILSLHQKSMKFMSRNYSPQDIALFKELMDEVLDQFIFLYGISDQDRKLFWDLVSNFGEAPSQAAIFTTDTIPSSEPVLFMDQCAFPTEEDLEGLMDD